MPRYFFHVSGASSFSDTVGVDLKDVSAAWSVAVVSCGEILTDLDGEMPSRSEVRVTVKDEKGHLVAIVKFTGERQPLAPSIGAAPSPDQASGIRDRMVAAIDSALDWIKDVHDPDDYGDFAADLANAALVSIEEGDRLGRGLVAHREPT